MLRAKYVNKRYKYLYRSNIQSVEEYQIYKHEAEPSVHTSDINQTPQFVCSKVNHSLHSLASKFWTLILFKL